MGSSSRSLPHAARTIVASDRNRRLVVNRLEERLVAPELLPHPARQMNPLLRQVLAQARPFPRLHDHRVDRLQPPEPVVSVRNAEASMRPSRRSSFAARLREATQDSEVLRVAARQGGRPRRAGRGLHAHHREQGRRRRAARPVRRLVRELQERERPAVPVPDPGRPCAPHDDHAVCSARVPDRLVAGGRRDDRGGIARIAPRDRGCRRCRLSDARRTTAAGRM